MQEIILHIGRHKTGTSAIQTFLALNCRALLQSCGILYANTGRDPRKHYHHALFTRPDYPGTGINSSLLGSLIQEASSSRASRLLLSSETLSRQAWTAPALRQLRMELPAQKISVVVYLRRQDRYLQSVYAERVKRGLLAAPMTIADIDGQLDYYVFLQKYSEAFGNESVSVRTYEDACRRGLFADFMDAIGETLSDRLAVPTTRVNQRFSWRYLELLRYANRSPTLRRVAAASRARKIASSMSSYFPGFMDSPAPLSPDQRQLLLTRYSNSNRRVAETFLDRPELFSHEDD